MLVISEIKPRINTTELTKLMRASTISIVIPCYNMGRFLPSCLSSIAKQRYLQTEVIIIDGGSTDDTPDVIRRYSDVVTRYVREPDQGQADAVTKGLRMVSGEIVHWHAADDIVMPNAFQRVVREFEEDPHTDLIFSNGLAFTDTQVFAGEHARWVDLWTTLLFFGRFQSDCAYWRRSAMENVLPLDHTKPLMCDEDFFLRMWPGREYKWIDGYLGAFRIHGDQVSARVSRATLKGDRKDTRDKILRQLGMGRLARIRKRVCGLGRYCVLGIAAPKLHSAARFALRRLSGDYDRKVFQDWFLSEWTRPIH